MMAVFCGESLQPLRLGGARACWGADAAVGCAHLCCRLPGTVLDHLVGEETMADYLLYTLNRHQLLG